VNAPATTTVAAQSPAGLARRAFTLVELLVVFIIISILAALSLGGLAGARQRAKIDKTRSTIRKLHEIVIPYYESFAEKRVSGPLTGAGSPSAAVGFPYWAYIDTVTGKAYLKSKTNSWTGPSAAGATAVAESRLYRLRVQQVLDLPDQWADVGVAAPGAIPSAAARRYALFKASVGPSALHQSAECLALIVTRGGFAGDATENFRADEMGDVDKDGAPEFLDAWGKPIAFIRWPSGYVAGATNWQFAGRIPATQQVSDPVAAPDPLDPLKVTSDFNLTPLIFSGGPDEAPEDVADATRQGYGLVESSAVAPNGWLNAGVTTTCPSGSRPGDINITAFPAAAKAVRDTISNHDLTTK
jgi:prepilin-type N-terminal cleavage/methylation domain-containing protein